MYYFRAPGRLDATRRARLTRQSRKVTSNDARPTTFRHLLDLSLTTMSETPSAKEQLASHFDKSAAAVRAYADR